MTTEEYETYWAPALYKLYGNNIPPANSSEKLQVILGTMEFTDWLITFPARDDYPMQEGLKTILKMLAGPYGRTILKALEIRNLDEKAKEATEV